MLQLQTSGVFWYGKSYLESESDWYEFPMQIIVFNKKVEVLRLHIEDMMPLEFPLFYTRCCCLQISRLNLSCSAAFLSASYS